MKPFPLNLHFKVKTPQTKLICFSQSAFQDKTSSDFVCLYKTKKKT